MIAVTGIVFALSRIWVHFYKKSDSQIIVMTVFWVSYMMTQSYYAGAMTMFFSSEVTIPFEDLSGVMEVYPDWKFKIMVGTEILFKKNSVVPPVSAMKEGSYIGFIFIACDEFFFRERKPFLENLLKT